LAAIRYLIKKDPDTAYDMIYDFSNYLRGNIEALVEEGPVSLYQELEHVKAYVQMEQVRFKERLHVVYEVGEDFTVPRRIIELLVENSIKHGITPKADRGTIWIRSWKTENGYRILVEDDGVGFDAENLAEKEQSGFGYIHRMLLAYPEADMRIESVLGQGTKVWIELPLCVR
jgi:LytS/YehU family sensor histidine kinase